MHNRCYNLSFSNSTKVYHSRNLLKLNKSLQRIPPSLPTSLSSRRSHKGYYGGGDKLRRTRKLRTGRQEIICKTYKLLGSEMRMGTLSFHSLYVVYKDTKDLRFRLAETEHELVVRNPRAAGFRPTVVQPQTVAVASQPEDERVAARDGDLLHAHINPFI